MGSELQDMNSTLEWREPVMGEISWDMIPDPTLGKAGPTPEEDAEYLVALTDQLEKGILKIKHLPPSMHQGMSQLLRKRQEENREAKKQRKRR